MGGSIPAPAMPAAPPAVTGGPQRGSLVLIRADGSEGESFPLSETTVIGRETGGLFASDSYLSPRHATFTFSGGSVTVQDDDSLNGVYLRIGIDQPIELLDRSIFRIGQEIIRFERLSVRPPQNGVEAMGSPNAGLAGRICLVTGREATGNCFPVPSAGMHLGRERGDILFPEDGYVSGLHCRIHEEGGRVFLTDVGSSNGTFVRLRGSQQIPSGSLLLMGQQLFRVEF
jgi:pSer/pThr/pTyr-binding forkhead associated (FHA) protein